MASPQPSLPSNRAFVVQFRAQLTDPTLLSWEGRVEHLNSGQVLRFHSPEELLAFFIAFVGKCEAKIRGSGAPEIGGEMVKKIT